MDFKLNKKTASLLVLVSATLCGVMGPLNKIIVDAGIDYQCIHFLRSIVALIFFIIVTIIVDRNLFKIKKEHILLLIALGFCKSAMDISSLHAQQEISLSMATVLQMTAPIFLIIFARIIFKDEITPRKVIAIILGVAATCMVVDIMNAGAINLFGVLLGLGSGITYACYMVISKILTDKGYHVLTMMVYAFIVVVIMTSFLTPVKNNYDALIGHPEGILILLVVGACCTALPVLIDTAAVKYVDVTVITVLSMFEIAVASVLGMMFFDEPITVVAVVGIILLVISIAIIDEPKKNLYEYHESDED